MRYPTDLTKVCEGGELPPVSAYPDYDSPVLGECSGCGGDKSLIRDVALDGKLVVVPHFRGLVLADSEYICSEPTDPTAT